VNGKKYSLNLYIYLISELLNNSVTKYKLQIGLNL